MFTVGTLPNLSFRVVYEKPSTAPVCVNRTKILKYEKK